MPITVEDMLQYITPGAAQKTSQNLRHFRAFQARLNCLEGQSVGRFIFSLVVEGSALFRPIPFALVGEEFGKFPQ